MDWYREWCQQPNRRKGRMVKVTDIQKIINTMKDPGYSSIYAFKERDALEIKESGCSKGLNKYEVGADCLVIDIDRDTINEAKRYMEFISMKLEYLDIYHTLWFSGSKGFHIYIPHEWTVSVDLPYTHKMTCFDLGFDEVDQSLYQHGRVLSLPGRVHPKTGKKKEQIGEYTGQLLQLKHYEKPEVKFDFKETDKDLSGVLSSLVWLCNADPGNGSRHTYLWGMAKDMAAIGIDQATTEDLLQKINSGWSKPKPSDEVTRAVIQGYKG